MGWQETRWYPGFTPVMLAARAGNVQVVRKLIEMKIDLNAVDDLDGRNALMFAILNGHNKVANYLIEAGADLNVIDYRGQTSLDHAKNAKNIDLIRLISAELSASR